MPRARLPMRKIRDMLRLTAAGMSSRAASLSIGGTTPQGEPPRPFVSGSRGGEVEGATDTNHIDKGSLR
jgi:hypothetical protein